MFQSFQGIISIDISRSLADISHTAPPSRVNQSGALRSGTGTGMGDITGTATTG